uniref:(northern house mosquito) hypothetical protein n=1 Tax=Culex pipiens TaxID=7175 RepID=A0A8D8D809_CULPI
MIRTMIQIMKQLNTKRGEARTSLERNENLNHQRLTMTTNRLKRSRRENPNRSSAPGAAESSRKAETSESTKRATSRTERTTNAPSARKSSPDETTTFDT